MPQLAEPDVYVPHAASDVACLIAGKEPGVPEGKLYAEVFPRCSNIVSASIPMGMNMAFEEGRLKRESKVVFCPSSTGMVYSVIQFVE